MAASYGQYDFGIPRDGVIALWTLKNPKYPEKVIKSKYGVTVVRFNQDHPHLLAAGMHALAFGDLL